MAEATVDTGNATDTGGSFARTWFYVLGAIFLILGLLGLFPAAVEAFHALDIHLEGGENVVHWTLGILHLALAFLVKDRRTLANLAIGLGIVYLLVALAGVFVPNTFEAAWWHLDAGDNWFHLLVGLVTLWAGWASRSPQTETRRATA